MQQTINICVCHNNETARLDYLRPKTQELAVALRTLGGPVVMHDIGPDASGMAGRVPGDTPLNRLRRAWQASTMFDGARLRDPRCRDSVLARVRRRLADFRILLGQYSRSIRIEQEVLYAHAKCWEIAAQAPGCTIVLESDAVFRDSSIANVTRLASYVLRQPPGRRVYVDLAGGCNVADTLNAWCFEPAYGMRPASEPELALQDVTCIVLPTLATNTVGGYIVSSELGRSFARLTRELSPMVTPDWALDVFALHDPAVAACLCLHTLPTVLVQGSTDGTYSSSIDARAV